MTKARNIAELANDISVDSNRDVTLSNLRSDQPMMFRNKIINGDMRIDQRNAGGSVSLNSTFVFPVDRFRSGGLGPWSGSADIRAIQSTDAPAGFQNSVKIYTNTTASSSASDNYAFATHIEGYDITDINFGTNDAKSLNLSFYVKGTSGTYGLGFNCGNGMYVTTYTVTSNWNRIVISIPENVAYTPDSLTNGYGCWIIWDLGAGSNFETTSVNEWQLTTTPRKARTSSCIQFGSTTGAEIYITGVQLEVGTVPTPFEHRPYGTELALCQRYYEKSYDISTAPGSATGTGTVQYGYANMPAANYVARFGAQFKVSKRSQPTIIVYDTAGNPGKCNYPDTIVNQSFTVLIRGHNNFSAETSSLSNGSDARIYFHYTAESEL